MIHHHSSSPKTPKYSRSEDQDVLESLSGLSIKGFQDWYNSFSSQISPIMLSPSYSAEANSMSTPSSTNASLPTPPALRSSRVFLASPADSFGDEMCPEQPPFSVPNAPLMKDLDSFTEGTGQGSFDFPLGPCAEDTSNLPLLFHPEYLNPVPPTLPLHHPSPSPSSSPLALDLLPETQDPTDAVLAWREKVIATLPAPLVTPKKRRRSLTQDPDTDERRTRAWSPTVESSLMFCTDQVERQHQPYCTDAQPPD